MTIEKLCVYFRIGSFEPCVADSLDPRGCGLSKTSYQVLGGIKRHANSIIATTCPTVNSYKRLIKTGSMTGYTWA
ncbi:MAG: hypothetical protein ACE1Y4_03030, partial [Lysobacterales bacterium]